MEKDILTTILENKRSEVKRQKEAVSQYFLEEMIQEPLPCISLKDALSKSAHGIIAEFKRRSPSKGFINENLLPEDVVIQYAQAGAAALSILTDEKFFGGSLKDLRNARPHADIPLLRKDFIIDEYQLYQAKAVKADVILLIAAALDREECRRLAHTAHQLNMEVLLEVHNEQELDCLNEYIDVLGVNNRRLRTFETCIETSFRIAEKLPEGIIRISESGISEPEDIITLRNAGYRGFLIGENFMKTPSPGETLKEFILAIGDKQTGIPTT